MDIPLVGGHTIAHDTTLIGFSMHGFASRNKLLRKIGARPGDALVLTKPLGTGVLLAAARAGYADSDWIEAATLEMMRSNAPAMRLLLAHKARACTDVTGFGLFGHLRDLVGNACAAEVEADAVPSLAGATELLAAGWRSSFHAINTRSAGVDDALPLLFDPQTSGGLLAAVPADQIDALLAASIESGEALHVIGRFIEANAEPIVIK